MGREIIKYIWKRRLWLFGFLGILGVWGILYLRSLPDGKLRLVFCDVGQGDGIYINLPDGSDVLVDGGPDSKVLECLGENMPFWDRKLELVVLTHPQKDHLNGLIEVVKRYEVDWFITSPIGNETKGYQELIREIGGREVKVRNVYAGDTIKIQSPKHKIQNKFQILNSKFKINSQLPGEAAFRVLWPSWEFVAEKIGEISPVPRRVRGSEIGDIGEIGGRNVLGVNTAYDDLNDFSIVMELKFGEFEALLTGDADEEIQDEIMAVSEIRPVEVFKIPHHGSKHGILTDYLETAHPLFAVVSAGKNPWGHPTEEILEKLEVRSVNVLRTDKDGDVTFTTDGKQVWVESDKK